MPTDYNKNKKLTCKLFLYFLGLDRRSIVSRAKTTVPSQSPSFDKVPRQVPFHCTNSCRKESSRRLQDQGKMERDFVG